jgi:hypothetical protein
MKGVTMDTKNFNKIVAKRWEIVFKMRREKVRKFLKEGMSYSEIADKMDLPQSDIALLAASLGRA